MKELMKILEIDRMMKWDYSKKETVGIAAFCMGMALVLMLG